MSELNRASEILDSSPYVELGDRHLEFRDDTPYEVWEAVLFHLKSAEKAVQWWIGDALQFGEKRYGEMYSQALDATDYSLGTLKNMNYVSGKVEKSRRRDVLSFGHHQEVAALPPEKQEKWLEKASPEEGDSQPKMSRGELREAIREERRAEQGEAAPQLTASDMSYRELEDKTNKQLKHEADEKDLADQGMKLAPVPKDYPDLPSPDLSTEERGFYRISRDLLPVFRLDPLEVAREASNASAGTVDAELERSQRAVEWFTRYRDALSEYTGTQLRRIK